MSITQDSIAIAEMAERTGLTKHTLRYYERAGLMLQPVERAGSHHRRYTVADADWVTFLTRLRSTGMPIEVIRQYTVLVRQGDDTTAARLRLLRSHRERVLARLAEVQDSLAAVDFKIALYEASTDHNAHDATKQENTI